MGTVCSTIVGMQYWSARYEIGTLELHFGLRARCMKSLPRTSNIAKRFIFTKNGIDAAAKRGGGDTR